MSSTFELETTKVGIENKNIVEVDSPIVTPIHIPSSNSLGYTKKEYSIIGDGLYASITAEEAPLWLTGILDQIINIEISEALNPYIDDINSTNLSLTAAVDSINQANLNIANALSEVQIAKNSYEELINIDASIDAIIGSKIEQLQTQMNDSISSVTDLIATKVTPDQAAAIAAQQLNSEIDDGRIKALATEISGTRADTASALAYTNQTLSAGFNGISDSVSQLTNTVSANASQAMANFGYNAQLTLGGVTYESGFGLATNLVDPSMPTGYSEFWVNADKFKLTSTGYNGPKYSPFEVDAATGTINLTGVVNISGAADIPQYYKGYGIPTIAGKEGDTYLNLTDQTVWLHINGSWSKLTGEDGEDAVRGPFTISIDVDAGYMNWRVRGQGTWIAVNQGTQISIVNSVYAMSGLTPTINDSFTVTIYASTSHSQPSNVRQWVYSTSGWLFNVTLKVSGDAIIDGTLSVSALNVSDIGFTSTIGSSGNSAGVWADTSNHILGIFGRATYSSSSSVVGVYGEGYNTGTGSSWGVWSQGNLRVTGSSVLSGSLTTTSSISASGQISSTSEISTTRAMITTNAFHADSIGWGTYKVLIPSGVKVGDTIYTFTGGHEAVLVDGEEVVAGDVIVDVDFLWCRNLSDALTSVRASYSPSDRPVGVYNGGRPTSNSVLELLPNAEDYELIGFNAVGEGMINVCGEGGNLSNGDLLCCSSTKGKAMRQNNVDGTPDDLIRNITVAKVRGNWVFDSPEEIKQVACIYVCG